MIQLKGTSGILATPKKFKSSKISHPTQTGSNSVLYAVNHNLGGVPDFKEYTFHHPSLGEIEALTFWWESTSKGIQMQETTEDGNTTYFRAYYVGGSTLDIQINLIKF